MKNLSVFLFLLIVLILPFCTSTKKASGKKAPKVTYMANIQPLIATNCTPCHMPPKGNKKPYDTYEHVKSDIDEILVRVQKNPGEKGFMPSRHPKLSDS